MERGRQFEKMHSHALRRTILLSQLQNRSIDWLYGCLDVRSLFRVAGGSAGDRGLSGSTVSFPDAASKGETKHLELAELAKLVAQRRTISTMTSYRILRVRPTRSHSASFASTSAFRSFPTPRCSRALHQSSTAAADQSNDTTKRPDNESSTSNKVVNLANLLSLGRLLSGPWIGHLILTDNLSLAVPCLIVSSITDWLDGYAARKTGTVNVLGSYLDPLADKVLVGSVVVSMGMCGMIDGWLFGLIVGRDAVIVGGSFALRFRRFGWRWPAGGWHEFFSLDVEGPGDGGDAGKRAMDSGPDASSTTTETEKKMEMAKTQPASPLYISKVNTVAQLGLVSGALMNAWVGWPAAELVTDVLGPVTAGTTVASGLAYIDAYRTGRVRI